MPGKQIADLYGDFIRRSVGADWTDDEIADVLGVTRISICLARHRLGVSPPYRGRTKERCRRARQRRFEDGLVRLAGDRADPGATPPMRMVRSEERQQLLGWISGATPRTRELINTIREGRSLAETGRRLGVTRERARQMRQRLLHDLRRSLGAETRTGRGMGSLPMKR